MQKHTYKKNKTFPQTFDTKFWFSRKWVNSIICLFLIPEVIWHWHLWGHILAVFARHALELCRVGDTHHLNIKPVYHSDQRGIQQFIVAQAFLRSHNSAPRPPPSPFLIVSWTGDTQEDREFWETTCWQNCTFSLLFVLNILNVGHICVLPRVNCTLGYIGRPHSSYRLSFSN